MALHVDRPTPPRVDDPPRLVLVHGFTQNSRCWGRFAAELSDSFDVRLVDAPGHGRSGHDGADLDEAGRLVVDAGGPAHYVGYSMGGRMALHGALARPEAFRSITLIGATGGIDSPDERAERRRADEVLASRIETGGLDAFLDFWLALPLFDGLSSEAAALDQRRRNRPEGLAASLRRCGTGTQEPLWDRLPDLSAPVLVVAGRRDAKFTVLGRRLAAAVPRGEFVSLPGGHAVHLEHPDATAAEVTRFVRSVGP